MPDISEIAADFRQALVDQDASAILEMTRRWTAVEGLLLTDAEKVVARILELQAEGLTPEQIRWRLFRLDSYRTLLAQIQQQVATYNQGIAGTIEDTAVSAQSLAMEHAAGLVEAVTSGQISAGFVTRLPSGVAENVAAIARAGQPLYNLLSNTYPKSVLGITNELIYGVSVGRNPRETARVIVRKGMAQGLQHILLVARDQQIRNYREMVRTMYDRSEVVSGYIRLAAKNMRTCLACLALDGTIYDTAELMALHPQDRCAQIPIVAGFPMPKFQTGEQWFRSLSPDEQREMMGPGRYEAWRVGRFQFGQLVTVVENETWGPSAQITAVSSLMRGEGGVERSRI